MRKSTPVYSEEKGTTDVTRREALRTMAAGATVVAASSMGLGSVFAQGTRRGGRGNPVPVALVGGTHIHAPGFAETMAETEGIETKYVWDPDEDTARRRQEVTGGDVVDDVNVIYDDPDVAGVVICSEAFRHIELVPAAAEAGKHVFVEKPVGMNGEEATRIAEAVNEAGVLFQTGYFMRSSGQHQFVRELIQDGTLGDITRLRLSNVHSGAIGGWFDDEWRWMANLEQAGVGGYGDLGSHVIDLLLWFMAGDQANVCTGHVDQVLGRYGETDEYGEGMIRFNSGAVATVAAGWVDRANPNVVEVSGTEGHVRITQGELFVTSEELGVDGTEPWTDVSEGWPHPLDMYLQALQGEENLPLITADETAYANRVVTAIYRGAEEQTWSQP